MNYKEAYRLVKRKYPHLKARGYIFYRNRYFLFLMEPNEGYPKGEVLYGGYPCFSVDKNSGEIQAFNYREHYDEVDASPYGRFDEKDIL